VLDKFEEAIKAYKNVIKINPDKYGAYNNMGLAYTGLDKFEEAIKAYEDAIEINPNYDTAYYNMGIAYTGFFKRFSVCKYCCFLSVSGRLLIHVSSLLQSTFLLYFPIDTEFKSMAFS
jgi:tetratricopeptide (TPR) repeat protein